MKKPYAMRMVQYGYTILLKIASLHAKIIFGQPTKNKQQEEMQFMSSDTNSLAHTKWNCKYHILFAPKYRRQIIYGKIKKDIEIILRQLCERKGVEIIEAEACKDYKRILVSISSKFNISQFVGYLTVKSSLMFLWLFSKRTDIIFGSLSKRTDTIFEIRQP